MAAYLTEFMLWDSLAKDILLISLAFFAAQITWLAAARSFPALRTRNKDGVPLYMPLPRVLILCTVFTAIYLPLAAPSADKDSTTTSAEISIKKTTIIPPKSGEENF